jgi:hypothetical protein
MGTTNGFYRNRAQTKRTFLVGGGVGADRSGLSDLGMKTVELSHDKKDGKGNNQEVTMAAINIP